MDRFHIFKEQIFRIFQSTLTDGNWFSEFSQHPKLSSVTLNSSAWRHLIPGQYCAVGGFSTWVFKFEPESAKHFKSV
jgi:hypothetical protein